MNSSPRIAESISHSERCLDLNDILMIYLCKNAMNDFFPTDLVPVSFLSDRFKCKEVIMKHHGLGSHGTYPIARALIVCTLTSFFGFHLFDMSETCNSLI